MSEVGRRSARVGVRELRQNLSVYLDRVRDGERLVVTERGHAVAELGPLTPRSVSVLERLIDEGRARPAVASLGSLELPPESGRPPGSRTITDELLSLRDEEPW